MWNWCGLSTRTNSSTSNHIIIGYPTVRSLRRLLYLIIAAVGLGAIPASAQVSQTFVATLSGSTEVPSITSQASGSVEATLTGNILMVSGSFANLESNYDATVGSHLHVGHAGQNGSVQFALTPALDADLRGGTWMEATNTFTLTTEQVAALEARGMYVNVHTEAHASGELRGQLLPEADATYRVVLSGGAEAPSNTSTAYGALIAEVRGSTMTVTGAFAELEADLATDIQGGAHIHSGEAGTNGGIEFNLTAQADADFRGGVFLASDNTFELSAQQLASLETQGLYVNVHSDAFPGGELRGQFMAEAGVDFMAQLSGANEGSSVSSEASGTVVASLEGNTLTVSGSFDNLESDFAADVAGGAHIHGGMAGQTGGIEFPLTVQVDGDARGGVILASENSFQLSAEQAASLSARGLYVNIHSSGETSGEIRGQLMAASSTSFTVLLDGDGEAPTAETGAEGTLLVEANTNGAIVSGAFELEGELATNVAGGAHIHEGEAGVNGSIVAGLNATVQGEGGIFHPSQNTISLTAEQQAMLQARQLYVNIHSSENASGEIRGQLVPSASVQFEAVLSGHAEAPGNDSGGSGSVLVEVNGDQVIVTGAFADLSADLSGGAHIHSGEIGANGDVAIALNAAVNADNRSGVFLASDNTFSVTAEQKAALESAGMYVNVHSSAHAAGELRGQITTPDAIVFEATLSGSNETDIVTSGAGGFVTAMLDGNTLTVSGSFDGLSADLATDIAGGAHLHTGSAGTSGDVAVALNVTADASLRSGTFEASQNTFTLTEAQVEALIEGDTYINIHSADHAAGEVRGQLLVSANAEPSKVEITAPLPSVVFDVDVVSNAALMVDWTDAEDPNGNEVTYVWELSGDASFSTILMQQRVESASSIDVSAEALADLLVDQGVAIGATGSFFHRVTASDGSGSQSSDPQETTMRRGVSTSTDDVRPVPETFELLGNYPNPFNPETTVSFDLPQSADVQVAVYNVLGQRVFATPVTPMEAGAARTVTVNASSLPSGVYLYRVIAEVGNDSLVKTGQMTLIK